MYPSPLTYHRPQTLADAQRIFAASDDASFLAGGHTLLPAMKNRLAAPSDLIDLRGVPELYGIRRQDGRIEIGAATTHYTTSTSPEVRDAIPALAALAGSIADPQVRNFGTMGGALANNDPAADYPAALLALDAAVVTTRRRIAASDFFLGMFETALDPDEIITSISLPIPAAAGYAKLCSQASRYAMAGVFVARLDAAQVRVAVTGAGNDGVFRWAEAEEALLSDFSAAAVSDIEPDEEKMISDHQGDPEYRANLVREMTRLAVQGMGGATIL